MNDNESVKNDARINTLVEKLKSKLNNFVVVDVQGELMGQVKDIVLDPNRQLNLVISRLTSDNNSRLFLLLSKLILKIDPPNKSVSVNINKAQVQQLQEYVTNETTGGKIVESLNNLTMHTNAADEGMMQDNKRTSTFESSQVLNELDDIVKMDDSDTAKVWGEEIIRLLGERLVVDRNKRKVGEVIVRKEIETRMVQVPVRYEKLIVEQVGSENKQLAEIQLGQGEISGIDLHETATTKTEFTSSHSGVISSNGEPTVRGEFISPKIASLLLNAIAQERNHGCKKVRVEIVFEDVQQQKTYQEWFDRCTL